MAERIVLDASSAIAMVRAEPDGPSVRRLVMESISGERWVSWFFWYEVANSFARRHRLTAPEVLEGIAALDDLDLSTADGDAPLSWRLSRLPPSTG